MNSYDLLRTWGKKIVYKSIANEYMFDLFHLSFFLQCLVSLFLHVTLLSMLSDIVLRLCQYKSFTIPH